MNKNLPIYLVIIVLTAIVVGGSVYWYKNDQDTKTKNDLQAQIDTLKNQTPAPTTLPLTGTTYANKFLNVNIPSDWTATLVAGNNAAVNITKGKYILYINTNATQASGVTGGRFAEIGQGAPSADAVLKSWPADPCLAPVFTDASSTLYSKRADLYVGPSAGANCNLTTDGSTAWYFSYLTDSSGRYFNDYAAGQNPGLVVTMSYEASSVNSLPKKDDFALKTALDQMTAIAGSLTVVGH